MMQNSANSSAKDALAAVAARIARVRADSGLTQIDFATRVGFPKRTYLAWERAESVPSIWLLTALKGEFGIDPDWVLNGPEAVPRRYRVALDWGRYAQIYGEVERILFAIGIKPTTRQIIELSAPVFEESSELDGENLEKLKKTLKSAFPNGQIV